MIEIKYDVISIISPWHSLANVGFRVHPLEANFQALLCSSHITMGYLSRVKEFHAFLVQTWLGIARERCFHGFI